MKKIFKKMMVLAIALAAGITANAQTTATISNSNSPSQLYLINNVGPISFTTLGATAAISTPSIGMNWQANNSTTPTAKITGAATGYPGGATVTYTWSVSGDLQIGNNILQNGAPTTTATGTGIVVSNWNSNTRWAGGANPYDQGQGKGRITFTASWMVNDTNCTTHVITQIPQTVSTSVDVYKVLGPVTNLNGVQTGGAANQIPPIVGPACLKPNTKYTFSVDPDLTDDIPSQIGVDRYLWSVNNSNFAAIFGSGGVGTGINYYSADSSEITLTTGNAPLPTNPSISCSFGICNFAGYNTAQGKATSTLNIGLAGAAPIVTATSTAVTVTGAGFSYCIPIDSPVTVPLTLTVTNPQVGSTYTWGLGTYGGITPNGWTSPTQSGTTAPFSATGTSLIITAVGNQPGTITLTEVDACGNITNQTYTFQRSESTTSYSLLSYSSTCTTPGTAITATLAASANENIVAWTPLTNWTFSSTNPYTITPNASVVPGVYTLTANLGCGSTNYIVNVKPASLSTNSPVSVASCTTTGGPITVSSPASICTGCSFAWGAYLTGTGVTANTATALSSTLTTTSAPTSGSFTGTYTIATGCATTASVVVNIAAGPAITAPACVNYNTNGTYPFSVTPVSGATNYTWSCSASGSSIASGQGTTASTISVLATTATYTVSCVIATSCGNVTVTKSVTPVPLVASETVLNPNFGSSTVYGLNLALPTGPTYTYAWTENSTATPGATAPCSPTNTANYTGCNINTPGSIFVCVTVTPSTGCISSWCVGSNNYRSLPVPGGGMDLGALIKLYPNPNKGQFTLSLPSYKESANVSVLDMDGKEVMKTNLTLGDNLINDTRITSGSYKLVINVDGVTTIKSIIVTK